MYFHTDDKVMMEWLRGVLDIAAFNGQRVRLDVTADGCLKVKRGEGMWTAPFESTPDPYRDLSQRPHTLADLDGTVDEADWLTVGHVLDEYEVEFLRALKVSGR